MKCELCRKKIKDRQEALRVGTYRELNRGHAGIFERDKGIHLDCIKEMLEVLRSATLAMAPRYENEAPTGENDGN